MHAFLRFCGLSMQCNGMLIEGVRSRSKIDCKHSKKLSEREDQAGSQFGLPEAQ